VLILYKYYYCFQETPLYLNFMERQFSFMTQKYQNLRCRVKRTGPKSPTLPYSKNSADYFKIVLRRLHYHFVCSSTSHWRLAFFFKGGNSRFLPLFLRVGSAMMCRTIVVLQYCRRLVNFLNYWLTDTCSRT
jgi:hypothetical protein